MDNKKIIFQVTRTYMKKNRRRTLVTFFGILVMVVLMTAVFVGKDTVLDYMQRAVEADRGSWHYQVYGINKDQADRISELSFVDGFGISKPLGYSEFPQSGNPETTPFLEIKEYSPEIFKWMDIRIKDGRLPENASEVILSERALKEGADIHVGDVIETDCFDRYIHGLTEEETAAVLAPGQEPAKVFLPAGFQLSPGETLKVPDHFPYYESNDRIEMIHKPTGLKRALTVVGIMEEPFFGSPTQGGYIALTGLDDEVGAGDSINAVLTIDLATKEDCVGKIAEILDTSASQEERDAAIKEGNSYMTAEGLTLPMQKGRIKSNDMLLSFAEKGMDNSLNFLLLFCQVFFVVLITAASLVLIVNVFSISYQERCKYLGMLSSVGATRSQKRWSVYYEVLILLVPALPLGILMGLLVIKAGLALLNPHFSKIMETVAQNIITGRSGQIGYRLVVNPLNILLVVLFSVGAVWISAWLPARKISKVGPVESIRGNDAPGKVKKKGYQSYLKLMLQGKGERLMGRASVQRNRTATKGMIRSITAFCALTLITAFAAGSVTDIVDGMANDQTFMPGPSYEGYEYLLRGSGYVEESLYQSCKDEIIHSAEVNGYHEMVLYYSVECVPIAYYREEYVEDVTQILSKWFPGGTPEKIQKYLTGEGNYHNPFGCPQSNIIIMTEDEFSKVARNAGIDLSAYEGVQTGPVLAYDSLDISTDDYTFFSDGAQRPDYTEYHLKNPLNVSEGENIDLSLPEYDEEKEEDYQVTVPVTFAGYIDADDIGEYFKLGGNEVYLIISEKTLEKMRVLDPIFGTYCCKERYVFFNPDSEDSTLLRNYNQLSDDLGRPVVGRNNFFREETDFKGAIAKIANIVAVCFILLISLICLLNLYHSVMGRSLARHKEMAVLHSMGITQKQKDKMLMLENIRIYARALLNSTLITVVFVICLHKLINLKFGRLDYSVPVWVIALTLLVSIAGLGFFTRICYRRDGSSQIIEEIRMESI